jgi:hypothetical protein
MAHHHEDDNHGLSIKILWGCLVLAASGLFALLPDDSRALRGVDSRPLERIGNAENFDASKAATEPERAGPEHELQSLRQKVRILEAEMAALKRCNPPSDR